MLTRLVTTFVLPPGGPLLLLAIALMLALVGRRGWALFLGAVAFLSLYAVSTPWVAGHLVRSLERQHLPVAIEELPEVDAIVVLGGAIGPAVPPRQGPDLSERADRALHAAHLYRAGKAPLVIPTGAYRTKSEPPTSEADEMATLLVEWGVPEDAILIEPSAGTTYENALEVEKILRERELKRVLLVTSAIHLPRSLATFKTTSLDIVPAPTDYLAIDGPEPSVYAWLPHPEALEKSARSIHEWLGLAWYRLRGWAE